MHADTRQAGDNPVLSVLREGRLSELVLGPMDATATGEALGALDGTARVRTPVRSSPADPPSPGKFPGGAVCVAIGVEFLIRNDAVGPQGPLLSFRQERSLQFLVTEVRGILVQDLPFGKRPV